MRWFYCNRITIFFFNKYFLQIHFNIYIFYLFNCNKTIWITVWNNFKNSTFTKADLLLFYFRMFNYVVNAVEHFQYHKKKNLLEQLFLYTLINFICIWHCTVSSLFFNEINGIDQGDIFVCIEFVRIACVLILRPTIMIHMFTRRRVLVVNN